MPASHRIPISQQAADTLPSLTDPVASPAAPADPDTIHAYEILNLNSNLCLDVYRASKDSGANVDQWTCNGGSNQYWVLYQVGTFDGNPVVDIVNNNSADCLDVYHASLDVGANVDQWTCNNHDNQLWIDYAATTEAFENYNSFLALDVYKASKDVGANVDQWTPNGGANQSWYTP